MGSIIFFYYPPVDLVHFSGHGLRTILFSIKQNCQVTPSPILEKEYEQRFRDKLGKFLITITVVNTNSMHPIAFSSIDFGINNLIKIFPVCRRKPIVVKIIHPSTKVYEQRLVFRICERFLSTVLRTLRMFEIKEHNLVRV